MSVLGCAPASLHPTYDSLLNTRFTGRLPRPLPVLPGLVQSLQRGLATTTRTSPRGTKRSPFHRHREAISLLACRQIPQGMLRYATPFCLTNSTSCGSRQQRQNG